MLTSRSTEASRSRACRLVNARFSREEGKPLLAQEFVSFVRGCCRWLFAGGSRLSGFLRLDSAHRSGLRPGLLLARDSTQRRWGAHGRRHCVGTVCTRTSAQARLVLARPVDSNSRAWRLDGRGCDRRRRARRPSRIAPSRAGLVLLDRDPGDQNAVTLTCCRAYHQLARPSLRREARRLPH
jgi:hypothetical protein